jgi:hypothetical protein
LLAAFSAATDGKDTSKALTEVSVKTEMTVWRIGKPQFIFTP